VVEIGFNGRNFTQLIALAPGVSNQTGQDEAKVGVVGSVKYSVNGGRVEYNTFDVDGSDLLNVGINGSNSTLIVYPSLDAIQEVKVLTSNYGAMYGRTASGTVMVATKTGTQDFHGDGYYFGRNEALNARNFFDETQGAPLYRRSDVGGHDRGPAVYPQPLQHQEGQDVFLCFRRVPPGEIAVSVQSGGSFRGRAQRRLQRRVSGAWFQPIPGVSAEQVSGLPVHRGRYQQIRVLAGIPEQSDQRPVLRVGPQRRRHPEFGHHSAPQLHLGLQLDHWIVLRQQRVPADPLARRPLPDRP
jgi:hypothetical protein